jgi:AICAR transformylase/IMP cyclohydrolase PurH
MIGGGEPAPELSVPLRRVSGLRYGENPHQPAAFYSDLSLAEAGRGGIAGAIQHHGKEVTHSFSSLHWHPSQTRRCLVCCLCIYSTP